MIGQKDFNVGGVINTYAESRDQVVEMNINEIISTIESGISIAYSNANTLQDITRFMLEKPELYPVKGEDSGKEPTPCTKTRLSRIASMLSSINNMNGNSNSLFHYELQG